MGTIKTTNIEPIADNGTVTLGSSGDTFTIPSGVTMVNNGTQTGFGGVNTPAFQAVQSSNQSFSDNSFTKATLATEVFDTNSNYDTSNYRFTPTVAGKYYVHFQWGLGGGSPRALYANIYKNGSNVSEGRIYMTAADDKLDDFTPMTSKIIEMNGSSDYLEFYLKQIGGSAVTSSNTYITFAEAYKIIE